MLTIAPFGVIMFKKGGKKMKKIITTAIIIIITLSILACGNNQQKYFDHLSGKQYDRLDGAMLTFYDDKTASYEYVNGMGRRFFYIYNVSIKEDGDKIVLSLENLEKETIEEAYLDMENDTITYYDYVYYAVK